MFFFFFKQKTAYEMRISDWSSDVCSSDLVQRRTDLVRLRQALGLRLGVDFLADDVVAQVNAFITDVYRGARDELAYFVLALAAERSAERRVGKECVRTCRSRWSTIATKHKLCSKTLP